MRKSRIDLFGAIILLAIMATLGLNQVAVKIVNEGISPLMQAALRSACAIPLIAIYMLVRNKPIDLGRAVFLPGIAVGVCFAAEFALLFNALEFTTVGRATIFFYTMPCWVAVGAHFLIPYERLTMKKLFGLAFACLGVTVALSSNDTPASPYALVGDLFSLGGAALWAAIALIVRTTKLSTASPELQLLYQITVSAILLLPLALLFGETFRQPTLLHWSIFSMQVVFVVCICFVAWFWVLSVYPTSDMASFGFLTPLFGVIFGWLILDEPLTGTILIALTLVAAGIVLVNHQRKPAASTEGSA